MDCRAETGSSAVEADAARGQSVDVGAVRVEAAGVAAELGAHVVGHEEEHVERALAGVDGGGVRFGRGRDVVRAGRLGRGARLFRRGRFFQGVRGTRQRGSQCGARGRGEKATPGGSRIFALGEVGVAHAEIIPPSES
jgi:hypothetical protein